ncbi:MAG TPA: hypothetical protein IAC31_02145 [Candidatus Faecousia intestinigallinarum]|nr:hypothetical protein [Candidatus Faecousia intestinigallinarum]
MAISICVTGTAGVLFSAVMEAGGHKDPNQFLLPIAENVCGFQDHEDVTLSVSDTYHFRVVTMIRRNTTMCKTVKVGGTGLLYFSTVIELADGDELDRDGVITRVKESFGISQQEDLDLAFLGFSDLYCELIPEV